MWSVGSWHLIFIESLGSKSPLTLSPRRLQARYRLFPSTISFRLSERHHREYKTLFGLPPMRDVERLREAAGQHGGVAAD